MVWTHSFTFYDWRNVPKLCCCHSQVTSVIFHLKLIWWLFNLNHFLSIMCSTPTHELKRLAKSMYWWFACNVRWKKRRVLSLNCVFVVLDYWRPHQVVNRVTASLLISNLCANIKRFQALAAVVWPWRSSPEQTSLYSLLQCMLIYDDVWFFFLLSPENKLRIYMWQWGRQVNVRRVVLSA